VAALVDALKESLNPDHLATEATVLVKGSRVMAMERVVRALTEDQHAKVAL
jgi:UDP-N-acetylmuramyl pentapeptide synthase